MIINQLINPNQDWHIYPLVPRVQKINKKIHKLALTDFNWLLNEIVDFDTHYSELLRLMG